MRYTVLPSDPQSIGFLFSRGRWRSHDHISNTASHGKKVSPNSLGPGRVSKFRSWEMSCLLLDGIRRPLLAQAIGGDWNFPAELLLRLKMKAGRQAVLSVTS